MLREIYEKANLKILSQSSSYLYVESFSSLLSLWFCVAIRAYVAVSHVKNVLVRSYILPNAVLMRKVVFIENWVSQINCHILLIVLSSILCSALAPR